MIIIKGANICPLALMHLSRQLTLVNGLKHQISAGEGTFWAVSKYALREY